MKVGFFTEGGFEGKIPKEYNNMRTDAAWMYLTDATHHPLFKINTLSDNTYDVGVMILPKKRQMYMNFPLLEELINSIIRFKESKKVAICILDAGLSKEIILLIDRLQNTKDLKMRIYAMISNSEKNLDYFLNRKPIKTEKLNVRSVKVYGDGALGSRGATLKFPYHDDKKNYGKLVTDPESLKKLASRIADANFQMNTHAIGDASISYVLNAYKKALVFLDDPRWRIEHVQIIDTSDISLFNKKIIPSVQPTHATSDMYWVEDRIGPSRMVGAYAYKDLLKEAGIIALGTDFPVEKVNPFHTFYAAVSRKDLSGYPEKGFQFQNALSREETLKGMTIWAAYLNFEEGEKGSIEKNKFADFIIVDRDIMKVDIKKAANTTVLKTYLSGELVYSYTKTN